MAHCDYLGNWLQIRSQKLMYFDNSSAIQMNIQPENL